MALSLNFQQYPDYPIFSSIREIVMPISTFTIPHYFDYPPANAA
jgi:hypothetical protein